MTPLTAAQPVVPTATARTHVANLQPVGLKDTSPGYLRELREDALHNWEGHGNRPITAPLPATPITEAEVAPFRIPNALERVFVDGHHVPGLDRLGDGRPGLAQSLAKVLGTPNEALEANLGRLAGDGATASLNTAFLRDGAFVHAKRGETGGAIVHLLYIVTGKAVGSQHVRNLIVADPMAEVTVVESYVGLSHPQATETTTVTEIVAAPNSRVHRVKLNREGFHARHDAVLSLQVGRDAQVHDLLFTFGAASSTHEALAALREPGSDVHLDGLMLATGNQTVSCPTFIEHQVPHTTSGELYKAVLDGKAHGSFKGNIKVQADAQKTVSHQTNRNLLLSNGAKMDSLPELEIHADDVQCSHGSAIGQLRPEALFFLRSRGLSPEQSRLLLTQAFAEEVLARAPADLRAMLDQLLTQWFACRSLGVQP